jgi:reversibly glycosylated polypeptide/UDP-arabinopyranose mutase
MSAIRLISGFVALVIVCAVVGQAQGVSGLGGSHRHGTQFLSNFPSTTGSKIPAAFKRLLNSLAPVDEAPKVVYGAQAAVAKLEAECGWDPATSSFAQSECISSRINFDNRPILTPFLSVSAKEVHIVVPAIHDLGFLEKWKSVLYRFDFIVVQDGDPDTHINIPDWVNYELYNRVDINKALGDRSWIFEDTSIRNFGFLVSNRTYIYTLDVDCFPAAEPDSLNLFRRPRQKDGYVVNALEGHLANLVAPSTPHYFNTLYDPYASSADFVRGYPYSMRDGVPTAISHGLWMNVPDYDAPTQMLKVHERNKRMVDAVVTIPEGTFYSMSSKNVAFNRKLIGSAFMQGLMGEGQPWARYDYLFAGWASKTCADHLNVGIKSGRPYIYNNGVPNPFTNLKKEYMGLFWQEKLIDFFKKVSVAPHARTAEYCYMDLAGKIREEFASVHPYFERLARAMEAWVKLWQGAENGAIEFNPSRQHVRSDKRVAVFTIVKNEAARLPTWLNYYGKHFAASDIYVLDNASDDGSANELPVNVVEKKSDFYYDHQWLANTVASFQKHLLDEAGYELVLFAEIDEIIVPDPNLYAGGLAQYLNEFKGQGARVTAFEVVHDPETEPILDDDKPILLQRRRFVRNEQYDKPLLTRVPLTYNVGFHNCSTSCDAPRDSKLFLFHLHHVDIDRCIHFTEWKAKQQNYKKEDVEKGMGIQHRLEGDAARMWCLWKEAIQLERTGGKERESMELKLSPNVVAMF